MPVWQYLITGILLAISFLIFFCLTLKYCELNDLKLSLWLIAPCFTIFGILIIVICLLIISNILIISIIISISWGVILGILLGISYYKTRKRIEFKRKGDLL